MSRKVTVASEKLENFTLTDQMLKDKVNVRLRKDCLFLCDKYSFWISVHYLEKGKVIKVKDMETCSPDKVSELVNEWLFPPALSSSWWRKFIRKLRRG